MIVSEMNAAVRALDDLTAPMIDAAWTHATDAECTSEPILRPWDMVLNDLQDALPGHLVEVRYSNEVFSLSVGSAAYIFSWEVAYRGSFYLNEDDEEGLSLYSMPAQQTEYSATELEPNGMKLAARRFKRALRTIPA